MNIRAVGLVALFAAGYASAATSFAEAQKLYDYQASDAATSKAYAKAWETFHNAHYPTAGDDCFSKADGDLVQILELDATGKVVGYFTDKNNDFSQCLRKAYLGLIYPAPPIAPFYHRLVMMTQH